MKLARIEYQKHTENKGILTKLPESLRDLYFYWQKPYTLEPYTLLGAEGYRFLLYQGKQPPSPERKAKIKQQLLTELQQKDVGVLLTDIPFSPELPTATGKVVHSLLAVKAIEKAVKRQGKTLQDSHILLIDGGNFITQTTLAVIYPHINDLSIYTDRQENFIEKTEEIYEETGLSVQVFSGSKNKQMAEANVIVNCGCDMENYDYTLQKNAFYFDIAQNREKLRRLRSRRSDMLFCDGLFCKKERVSCTGAELEGALRVTNEEFRRFLCSRYEETMAKEAMALLQDTSVVGLTCLQQRI